METAESQRKLVAVQKPAYLAPNSRRHEIRKVLQEPQEILRKNSKPRGLPPEAPIVST